MADWTNKQIERLAKLWSEGYSTTEIGKKLGFSKNAVVGKVHRLGLASRNSPIRNVLEKATSKSGALKKSAKTTTGSNSRPSPKPVGGSKAATKASKPIPKAETGKSKQSQTVTPAKPAGVPLMELSSEMCCWPIDSDGEIQLFCGRRIFKSKPYCLEHCIMAYTNTGGSEAKESIENSNSQPNDGDDDGQE